MNKPASLQLANLARPTRRSLIEFTMPATDGAVVEQLRPPRPAVRPQLAELPAIGAPPSAPQKKRRRAPQPAADAGRAAPVNPPRAAPLDGANADRNGAMHAIGDATSVAAAANICVTAFEMMTANMKATLEYAGQLSDAKTPSEFFQLSAGLMRRQVELAVTHSTALGTLSRSLTTGRQPRPSKRRA